MTLDKEGQRRRTSFHEAGHTVAAWLHGLPIRGATIKPTILYGGFAFVGLDVEDALLTAAEAAVIGSAVPLRARRLLEAEGIVDCAGELAVERAIKLGLVPAPEPPPARGTPEDRRRTLDRIDARERARVAGELRTLTDAEHLSTVVFSMSENATVADAYRALLIARTEALLDFKPLWRAVCALADELFARTTLSGAACRRVIENTLTPPPSPHPHHADAGYYGDEETP